MASVLEVIYLIFNEGYSATAGNDWMRPGLCEDALRIGRTLAELMPEESEARGPAAGLELADQLASDGALDSYHLLASVRGDLLEKLGRIEEARMEFERAAAMTDNARERSLLQRRAAACVRGTA